MFKQDIRLTGSSRTDSGVHAKAMVANFYAEKMLDADAVLKGLNSLLPNDIAITKCFMVPKEFHSCRDALSKLYCYRIHNSLIRNPLINRQSWNVPIFLDWDKMRDAAYTFVGTHDFSSFKASDSNATTFVRTIEKVYFNCNCGQDLFEIYFQGKGFLKFMVRNMVGTLYDIGRGKISPDELPKILAAKDRRQAGITAPAHGLTLEKVYLKEAQSHPL